MNTDFENVYRFHPSLKGYPILIVDDDSTIRKILRKMLESSGFSITEAASGNEALQHLENNLFTLVLLDIVMPDFDGLEVLKAIRKSYSVSELPVIMVTVKDSRDDITEALSLGANDYVVKPVDFPVLRARIDNHLILKQLQDELRQIQNDLEQRVQERTFSLEKANKALEDEINHRKKIEESLRETTLYYQSLIEHTHDIIVVIDTDGTIFYESPSVENILGYLPEERIGKNAFELLHPDDLNLISEKLKFAFSEPDTILTETARFKHKDGNWRYLETIGRATTIHGQLRYIVNCRDVTGRK